METPRNQTLARLDLAIGFVGKRHIHIRNNTAEVRWPYGAYQFWISLRPFLLLVLARRIMTLQEYALRPDLWTNAPQGMQSEIGTAYPHIIFGICAIVGNANMATRSQCKEQLY